MLSQFNQTPPATDIYHPLIFDEVPYPSLCMAVITLQNVFLNNASKSELVLDR